MFSAQIDKCFKCLLMEIWEKLSKNESWLQHRLMFKGKEHQRNVEDTIHLPITLQWFRRALFSLAKDIWNLVFLCGHSLKGRCMFFATLNEKDKVQLLIKDEIRLEPNWASTVRIFCLWISSKCCEFWDSVLTYPRVSALFFECTLVM